MRFNLFNHLSLLVVLTLLLTTSGTPSGNRRRNEMDTITLAPARPEPAHGRTWHGRGK